MISFLLCLALLIIGYFVYGKIVDNTFGPDDRETPAVRINDGVDYVVMPQWKLFLVQLLNIAGLGPIFGALQGALWGPVVFLWITFGTIFAGGVHDYFSGMMSERNDGASIAEVTGRYLGPVMQNIMRVFSVVLLIMVGTVFAVGPAGLIVTLCKNSGMSGLLTTTLFWLIIILVYYFIATFISIDKIIGKIYPIFGAILLLSAVGVFAGIFIQGYQLDNIDFSHGLKGIFDVYPIFDAEGNSGAGTKFIPVFFVTVACGITSGFHSTQCTLIGRSVEHEKEGRTVFYGMMILEGLIAMIWAAAAMGLYNSGSTAGATAAVGEVAKGLLGPVGGIIAILGVIVLPITSGDTALRSCRLMVADYLHIDQKTRKNRVLVTLGIFIPVILILVFAKMNTEGFNILWRYFAWSNQTIGVFAFAAITIYLMAKKGAKKGIYLIALIPGSFYMFIISSFILSQKIGFGLPMTVAYIIAGVLTALYFAGLIKLGRKYAASHEEE